MDSKTREMIVRLLRAEADRIEAGFDSGYEPTCYIVGPCDLEVVDAVEAKPGAQALLDSAIGNDGWDEETELIAWGVMLDIEVAKLVEVGRDTFGVHPWSGQYELRPADDTTPPVVTPTPCADCEHEEACPPGGTCSKCGHEDPGCMP